MSANGRLIYRLEQRKESDLDDVEIAAMVASLRSFADALEHTNLDTDASDILESTDHRIDLHDHQPDNVE
jgi:hypothetical protein